MGKGKYDEIGQGLLHNPDYRALAKLTIGIIAAQVIGFIMVLLCGVWLGSYHNGYGWAIETVFNYHPLFMSIGMIFLYGDGKFFYLIPILAA
jgi:cytochrome b-561